MLNNEIKYYENKVFKYFNNMHANSYLNLSIKSGNSINFKKKYIKFINFFFFNNFNKIMPFSLNILLYLYTFKKYCYILLFKKSSIVFRKHKKGYSQRIGFSILKKNNSFFFLKYLKYVYLKKN
jgi:hypothetical protein